LVKVLADLTKALDVLLASFRRFFDSAIKYATVSAYPVELTVHVYYVTLLGKIEVIMAVNIKIGLLGYNEI
jgi:hypothetical protein